MVRIERRDTTAVYSLSRNQQVLVRRQLELELTSRAAGTDRDTQVFDTAAIVHDRSACAAAVNFCENGETDSERHRVIRALEECGGNQTQAARLLGVSRRTLVNRLEQFQLPRPRKR